MVQSIVVAFSNRPQISEVSPSAAIPGGELVIRGKGLTAADLGIDDSYLGAKCVCSPPPRERSNQALVWNGVQTGVFSQEQANKMLQNADYVPYYRENTDGTVSLMMGNEHIVSMGNVKDQPYLHELVGGDQRIADFMTSSVQNANMILEMGLRNQATKSVAFELEKIGLAKIGKGNVRSGTDVIKFKVEYY